ncbi:hypothetical protein GCM10011506_06750 [Marivirga lumbricoides]|uniref:Uncharacterized protein n=2 Tax=Marivirga lumbricoides TaxID=1046115 RepID=A0ABQ1LKX0_9BACT|nr:hypothetical protein GCM10011506_06750 [Marivirga lumbricoides]
MVVMQLGIFMDYWGDFSDNAWSVHIHYWTGTIWYIYLIIQPYYATHGQMEKHRTNGIIGMFLAGGVCLTALSMMHRDIMVSDLALAEPERFGPFKPWLFFGIASIEIIMMTAFGFAIIMSIIKRKSLEDHAWWLISTVFLIMMPAVGRGIQNLFIITNIKHWPDIDIITPIYISQALIILLLLLTAWKYKKLKHPATYLAVVVNVICCFVVPIGKSEAIQTLLRSMIKG